MEVLWFMVFLVILMMTGWVLTVSVRLICQSERVMRMTVTRVLDRLRYKPSLDVRRVRKTFQDEALPSVRVIEQHSHGESAAARSSGRVFSTKIAEKLGVPAYSYQMSSSDQYHKVSGYRDWRWSKDIPVEPRNDPETGLSYMIDVDYYMEMGDYLAGRSEPSIVYTTQPSVVAKSTGDSVHYFDNENNLITHVSGGAVYMHQIWDYTCDSFIAVKRLFGIPVSVTHYLVDHRQVTSERKMVLFTPTGTWTGFSSWFAMWWIRGTELSPLKPVTNGWATLYKQTKQGLFVSVGRAGTYGEATVPVATLERMFASDRLSKQSANVGSIASWAESDRNVGVILADYIRENKGIKAPYVANIEEGVINYTADLKQDGESKDTIAPFMPAIVAGGCFAPGQDKATTTWGVESRVTNLKQVRSLELSNQQKKLARVFVSKVVGNAKLSVVEYDDVYDNQQRRQQRAILEEASNVGEVVDDTIKSFMKREAYAKVGTPRVISTLPGLTKLEYSRYTLAASKHIKKFNWYAFRKPTEIAERVSEIVSAASMVAETDFSRMDGHVTQEVRELIEEPIMIGLFGEDKEMLKWMREQYNKPGALNGKNYETGFARASGSPETSLFNTILTAFISFCAMCELGMSFDKAWEALGVYGGDDGLVAIPDRFTAEQADKAYQRAARNWGQVLKLDFKKRGEPVQFLARFYGTAWSGGRDSMSDVKRQLVKFHTTIALNGMTATQKMADKARALLLTDKNTPILGSLAKKCSVEDVQQSNNPEAWRVTNHWSKFEEQDQFPNEYGTWMDDIIHTQMPDFDHEVFNNWILQGKPESPPQCLDLTPEFYKPEVTCIINDDIHVGTGIKPSNAIQASPAVKQVNKTDSKKRPTHKFKSETSSNKSNQSTKHGAKKAHHQASSIESCSSKASSRNSKRPRSRKGSRSKIGDRIVTGRTNN